eukprot:GHRQ01039429.1.p3 GENE.GHRQ01039429.1~~GHRQ01039429.1.p3  ORF type:complete len:106 (-),score=28.35 GHRQ01039429.1:34-351(-)
MHVVPAALLPQHGQLHFSSCLAADFNLDLLLVHVSCMPASGECSTLEKQLSEVQASEAGLSKAKAALEAKLAELEELLATTTTSRDELTGGHDALRHSWPAYFQH